jgi:hypothetical protein
MNSALESTLAVGDLRLVLAVVLVSGGGGGEGEASAGRGLSSTGKATSSGRSTTGGTSGGGEKYGPVPPQPLQSVSSGRRGGGAHKLLLDL